MATKSRMRSPEAVPDPGAPEIRRLVADMMQTMEDAPGVGLAGPQVYVPLRLFVFRVPADRASADPNSQGVPNTVLINPEFEPIGDEVGLIARTLGLHCTNGVRQGTGVTGDVISGDTAFEEATGRPREQLFPHLFAVRGNG